MKFWSAFTLLFIFIAFSQACKKENVYPIEPVIQMSDKQVYENPSKMFISFTDGDGDIGFYDGDTLPPYNYVEDPFNKYYYNLLLYYFEKDDELDEWIPIDLAVPYYYRVPYLTPTGQNKSLKGEIEVDITLPINRPDSVRFEIELIDRALNESERITTPTITK